MDDGPLSNTIESGSLGMEEISQQFVQQCRFSNMHGNRPSMVIQSTTTQTLLWSSIEVRSMMKCREMEPYDPLGIGNGSKNHEGMMGQFGYGMIFSYYV